MTVLSDNRGQALQVGAVLLFGLLIVLFTVWQAFVIPDQNERVEFRHNQDVQSEMVEIRGTIVSTADSTTPATSSVELGTQFPTRLLFVNPTPAAGSIASERVGNGSLVINNASSLRDDESQFWSGTNRSFETRSLRYTPSYRVFQGAPETFYDSTVAYNFFQRGGNSSALSEQALIDGDRITLVSLIGEYDESGIGSVTPDIQPVSTQTRNIPVENTGGNITIRLPTKLNASQWQRLLDGETNVQNVTNIGDETVAIELQPGSYELQLAQVGVGDGLAEPRPAYIAEAGTGPDKIPVNQNHTVSVEVRDKFNTPKSGVPLDASVQPANAGDIVPTSSVTNPEGQASFTFRPNTNRLNPGQQVNLTFESAGARFADNGVDNLTLSRNITFPPGVDNFEMEWQLTGPLSLSCEPSGERTAQECTFPIPTNGQNVSFELNVTSGAPGDTEVQLALTDVANASIDGGDYRRELNRTTNENVTVNLDPDFESSTTLVAIAGSQTVAVYMEPV